MAAACWWGATGAGERIGGLSGWGPVIDGAGGSDSVGIILWSTDGSGATVVVLVVAGMRNFLFLRVILPDPSIRTLYCLLGRTSTILPDLHPFA